MMTDPRKKRRFARTRDGTRDALVQKRAGPAIARPRRALRRYGDAACVVARRRAAGGRTADTCRCADRGRRPHREYSRLRLVARFAL